jgi:3-oxoacyl-[acyl-carrier-protein] synthase III
VINFKSVHVSLGSIIESNEDISELVGWSAHEISAKTGIKKRYISHDSESSESLALKAVSDINVDELNSCDLIISVTNTQLVDFPSIAHYVHSKLGLKENIKCIGINAGCTGFVDALEIAYSYFQSNFSSKALIINSDTYSKFLGHERSTRTLFSDGASATIVEKDLGGFYMEKKIHSSVPGTYDYLIKQKISNETRIIMDGPQVLKFAMGTVLKDLKSIIPQSECVLFPHQAGKLVLDLIQKKVPKNVKICLNYENYGNLVSASIPNLIHDNFDKLESDIIIFSGFGVGLSHNCLLFKKI